MKITKILFSIIMAVAILSPLTAVPQLTTNEAQAVSWDDQVGVQSGELEETFGNSYDPRIIVANIIKVLLGLLGIIFIVLIIISGYQIMTAGGKEDKVNEAKDRLKNAVIGLVIILAAYAITDFIVGAIVENVNKPY